MDSTTVVAVAGLFTTLAAPVVTNIFSSRSEREAWERGILDDALTQAVAYVNHLWARVDALTDPQAASRPKPLETSHRDIITARMRLHAPKKVFDAWHDLARGEDSFWYSLNTKHQGNQVPVIDWDDPVATRINREIEVFLASTETSKRRRLVGR